MKLIVGLGNPDKKYESTRHNVGFMVIDYYLGKPKYKSKFKALYEEVLINGEKVIFVKPQNYMNNSGDSVVEFVKYYDIDLSDILVIQDDLDLNIGTYRVKMNSSDGGHNGVKSIINRLNTKNFARLKVGIKNDEVNDTIDFVLGKFSKDELEKLNGNMEVFRDIIDYYITWGVGKTMNKYNTR